MTVTAVTGISWKTLGEQLRSDDAKNGDQYLDDAGVTWTVRKQLSSWGPAKYIVASDKHAIDGNFVELVTLRGFRKKPIEVTYVKVAPVLMLKGDKWGQAKITDTVFRSEAEAKTAVGSSFLKWLTGTPYEIEVADWKQGA